MWRAIAGILLSAGVTQAAVLDGMRTPTGNLTPTVVTSVTVSPNSVKVGQTKARSLVVTVWNTAGSAVVELQINCTSPQLAAAWATVRNSSTTIAVAAAAIDVLYPLCEYRVSVTTCTGCSVNAQYNLGPDMS